MLRLRGLPEPVRVMISDGRLSAIQICLGRDESFAVFGWPIVANTNWSAPQLSMQLAKRSAYPLRPW